MQVCVYYSKDNSPFSQNLYVVDIIMYDVIGWHICLSKISSSDGYSMDSCWIFCPISLFRLNRSNNYFNGTTMCLPIILMSIKKDWTIDWTFLRLRHIMPNLISSIQNIILCRKKPYHDTIHLACISFNI